VGIGHAQALAEAEVVLPSVAALDLGRFIES